MSIYEKNNGHPLMSNNINKEDIELLNSFLDPNNIPRLTNGPKVEEFEREWSKWLGVEHSLMVNSGSAANELTMLALKYVLEDKKEAEIILPPLTWISDVASVLFAGFKPVFCDINFTNLSFDIDKLKKKINKNTQAIFITHVLGINAITDELLELCNSNNILLIEDVCESHGATFKGMKAGSIGSVSNFSFYFAHHMSTIEGGMICTNNSYFYDICRAMRSHGMIREMKNQETKSKILNDHNDLNPDFVFLRPSHNFRSTEINAVIGLSQIKRLDENNNKRKINFEYFLSKLNSDKYICDIDIKGQSNYAFIVIMKKDDIEQRNKIETELKNANIEYRRGLSGGGNQLRQPYFKKFYNIDYTEFPNIEHIHNFSWYVGNYPDLEKEKIDNLLETLNNA